MFLHLMLIICAARNAISLIFTQTFSQNNSHALILINIYYRARHRSKDQTWKTIKTSQYSAHFKKLENIHTHTPLEMIFKAKTNAQGCRFQQVAGKFYNEL